MKEYRATTTLNTKGGLIRKGELVPKSYPRFDEGVRRGWIVLVDDKLADVKIPDPIIDEPELEDAPSEKSKDVPVGKEPKPQMEIPESRTEGLPDEPKNLKLEISPIANRTIESLEFLSFGRSDILHAEGIYSLEDLRGKSVGELTDIKGVGFKTANKLKGAFDAYDKELAKISDED